MKKLIIIILILLNSFFTQAQIDLGLRLGTGYSKMENMDGTNNEFNGHKEFLGGLVFDCRVDDGLSIRSGFNYLIQSGTKTAMQEVSPFAIPGISMLNGQTIYANVSNLTRINYLQVPVLAKLNGGGKFKYYMAIGPSFSFLLNAKRKIDGNSAIYLDKEGTIPLKNNATDPTQQYAIHYRENINGEIKKINIGVQSGCGFEYASSKGGSFFLEASLLIGATNIDKTPAKTGKHQANLVLISSGYIFHIK